MKHLDSSELVFGLILSGKINAEHVNPSIFADPYGEAVKLFKNGADVSDLYDKVGLAPVKAALEAGQIVDSTNPYDLLELLEKAHARETLANTLDREVNKLRRGDDADILKIESAIERSVNMEGRYTPLSQIDPTKGVWISTGYQPIDEYIGGIPDSNLTIIGAPPGCLVGSTMVGVNRGGKSFQISMQDLEYMEHGGYRGGRQWQKHIPTRIRSRYEDGTIRLSNIKSVLYSGVKPVYLLKLQNGMSVTGTSDHPIYTEQGWKQIGCLSVGDRVWVESNKQAKHNKQPKLQYREHEGLRYHPHAHTHGCHPSAVARHILVMESSINNISLDSWIRMGREGYDSDEYIFVGRDYHVHHKDHNTLNNSIENLELLTADEHYNLHSKHNWKNVSYYTTLESVESVTFIGERDTYDIEIDGEPHNFLANGIVVHNTGKTSLLAKVAISVAKTNRKVLFYTLEMTGGQIAQRVMDLEDDKKDEAYKDNIIISDEMLDVDEICSDASKMAALDKYAMIAIDFADLMLTEREEEGNVAQLYRAVTRLAKKSKTPVLLLSQLNRRYAEEGGIPRLQHLRWSGLAEALGALVLLIYNPNQIFGSPPSKNQSLQAHPGRGYIIEAKSRFGYKQGGVGAVDLEWDGKYAWGNEALGWFPLTSV